MRRPKISLLEHIDSDIPIICVYEGVTEGIIYIFFFLLSRKHLYGLLYLKKAGYRIFALQCHYIANGIRGKMKTTNKRSSFLSVAQIIQFHVTHLNKPRSIHQYSNMARRLSGQTSIFERLALNNIG